MIFLAITSANYLKISELWIAVGAGNSFRLIATHEIAKAALCVAFHCFTPVLVVTRFPSLATWARGCTGHIDHLWRHDTSVLLLECHASPKLHWQVNATTGAIWGASRTHQHSEGCKPGKNVSMREIRATDGVPPTKTALIQHTKRAAYQVVASKSWPLLQGFRHQVNGEGTSSLMVDVV